MGDAPKVSGPEQRILEVLSDGMIHTRRELREAVGTKSDGALSVYISRLRNILCEYDSELAILSVPNSSKSVFRLCRVVFTTLRL